MTDAPTPFGPKMTDADGRRWCCVVSGPYAGWAVRQHPDGQWVTMEKLDDVGVASWMSMVGAGLMPYSQWSEP